MSSSDYPPMVVLVGPPGSGKTTVRDHLATILDATPLGPDEFPGSWSARWDSLHNALQASSAAVVECVRVPYFMYDAFQSERAHVAMLGAPPTIRRERLEKVCPPPVARVRASQPWHVIYPGGKPFRIDQDLRRFWEGSPEYLAGMIVKRVRPFWPEVAKS